MPTDNETWLIEVGCSIFKKEVDLGLSALDPTEKLLYCLWVADYGMRNAGDLASAYDLYADFHSEGARIAKSLSLSFTSETFELSRKELQKQFLNRFECVCNEVKRHYSPIPQLVTQSS